MGRRTGAVQSIELPKYKDPEKRNSKATSLKGENLEEKWGFACPRLRRREPQ